MSEAEEERSEVAESAPGSARESGPGSATASGPGSATASGPEGPGAWTRIKRLVMGVVILGLALATLYLLAERNSRSYYLSTEDGRLVVSKGAWLPAGKRPYLPEEEHAARVYAPVPIPEGLAPIPEQRFEERQDLDRVLFEILAEWAEQRIHSEDPNAMRDGFALVERAGLFSGITSDQIARLRGLRSELAYHEGRAQVEEALARLREAREKLDLATEASSQRGQDAALLLQRIVPAMEALQQALRRAPKPELEQAPPRDAAARDDAPLTGGEGEGVAELADEGEEAAAPPEPDEGESSSEAVPDDSSAESP